MGISGWEALGYVFQGASEASDEIRKEDVALAMENFKHDKEVIGEIAKTRYATDLVTHNEESKKITAIQSALANIKNANDGKGMNKYNAAFELIMSDEKTKAMYDSVPDTEKTAFVTQYTTRFQDTFNDEGEVTGFTVNHPTPTLTTPQISDYFKGTEFWQEYAEEVKSGIDGPLVKQVKKLFAKKKDGTQPKITDSTELARYVKESHEIGGTTIVGEFQGEPVTSSNTDTTNLFKSKNDLVWSWTSESDEGAIKYGMVEKNYDKIVNNTSKAQIVSSPILALGTDDVKNLQIETDGTIKADGDAHFLLSQTKQLYGKSNSFLRDSIIWKSSDYPFLKANAQAMNIENHEKIFLSQWNARTITLDNEEWIGGGTVDGKYLIGADVIPLMIDENFNALMYNDEVMGIIEHSVNEFIAGKEGSLASLQKGIDNVIRETVETLKKQAEENKKNLELETKNGDSETEDGSGDTTTTNIVDLTQETFDDFKTSINTIKNLAGKPDADGDINTIPEVIAILEKEGFKISGDVKVLAPLVKSPNKYLPAKAKQAREINPEWTTWTETQLPLWETAISYLQVNHPEPKKHREGKGRKVFNPEWTDWFKKYGLYFKQYQKSLKQQNLP